MGSGASNKARSPRLRPQPLLNQLRQVLPTLPQLPPPPQRRLLCQRSPYTPSNQSNLLPPSPCTIRRHGGIARLSNNPLRPQLNPPTNNLPSLRLRLRPTRSRKPLHTTTENRKLIPEINFLSHTICDSSSDLTNPIQMYEILTIDPLLVIK